MSIHLMCLTSSGGLPVFTRKKGDCDSLPFSTVASLNGAHMFCKSQGIKLQSTHTEDWIFVWKDFEDTITIIAAGKGFTEKTLWNLLDLIFGSLILFIGLEALKSQKSYDCMKREAKHYIPVIDKILDNCEVDLLSFSDCILASENSQILSKLNEFSTQFGSLFCSVVINQKLAVGTEGWWDLDVLDRKLLTTVLNTAGSLQKDIPIFLPRRSPNTAYRFVSVPITGTSTLCAICGAEPPYHEVKLLVSQTWRNDLEPLLNAEQCMPRNFPNTMEVDSNILGIILINKQYGKYVVSRNLQQSASGKRTMSGSHRLDILRTFFHQAVDAIEDYLKDKTTVAGRKIESPTVLESYWCSDYHKCHAYTDSAGNLMCALYVASVPTYTMRYYRMTYRKVLGLFNETCNSIQLFS